MQVKFLFEGGFEQNLTWISTYFYVRQKKRKHKFALGSPEQFNIYG